MQDSNPQSDEILPFQAVSVYSKRWAQLDEDQWAFIDAIRRIQAVMDALEIESSATANLHHDGDFTDDGYVYVRIGEVSGRIDVVTEAGHLGPKKVGSLGEFVAEALAVLGHQPKDRTPATEL